MGGRFDNLGTLVSPWNLVLAFDSMLARPCRDIAGGLCFSIKMKSQRLETK